MTSPCIGVDLGGTKIEAIVLEADGTTAWRERVATPAGSYDAILAAIAGLLANAGTDRCPPGRPVGVGIPGTLTAAGLVKNANSTCLNGRALEVDLARVLGRPVRLANDANCLALSEATDGAGAGAHTVFAVILGTGCGAGITVGGRLLIGPNGLAGEWGHNPLPWADADDLVAAPPCWCGRVGCAEAWLSGPALAADHARRHPGPTTPTALQIAASAARGDAACSASLERHAARLARALAQVINLLDPDVIVLGGGLSNIDGLVERVRARWTPHVFGAGPAEPVRTQLVRSRHGDSSGVRGAAWLWRRGAPIAR